MKDDPNFKAALARQRDQQMAAAREQLNASVEGAARNVLEAVRQGHMAASMRVLQSVGLLGTRQADQDPKPSALVGNRAALALEARLGQLLSMLARHPAIAGTTQNAGPENATPEDAAPQMAPPELEARSSPSLQRSSEADAVSANPEQTAREPGECLTSGGGDNSLEAKK